PSAPELHRLRWELIRDPRSGEAMLLIPSIEFSRYLVSTDMRPMRLRPPGQLRALVVIADPRDLSEWQPGGRPLMPVDVAGELERTRQALGSIPMSVLSGPGTFHRLGEMLRDEYDILYFVGHGALIEGE